MSLRALSLDTTPPYDYEPDGLPENGSLTALADYFGSDKGSLKHNYTPVYERLINPFRGPNGRLLEIGIACGASLKMWARYFPSWKIVGVDIRPECRNLCAGYENVTIHIADATKEAIPGAYDVVIDDGSHLPGHIVQSFKLYWPLVKAGGWYFVEDLRCTHNPNYSTPFDDPQARDRAPLVQTIDALMQNCDNGGEVERIEHHRELLMVKKRG